MTEERRIFIRVRGGVVQAVTVTGDIPDVDVTVVDEDDAEDEGRNLYARNRGFKDWDEMEAQIDGGKDVW